MTAQAPISESAFLAMDFDGPEPEFVDGQVGERGTPDVVHSRALSRHCVLLEPFASTVRTDAFELPEFDLRFTADQFLSR